MANQMNQMISGPHMEQSEDLHLGFRGHFRDEPRRASAVPDVWAMPGEWRLPWSRTAGSDTRTRAPRGVGAKYQQIPTVGPCRSWRLGDPRYPKQNNCMNRLLKLLRESRPSNTFFASHSIASVTHGVTDATLAISKPWKSHLGIKNDVEMGMAETGVRTQEIFKCL